MKSALIIKNALYEKCQYFKCFKCKVSLVVLFNASCAKCPCSELLYVQTIRGGSIRPASHPALRSEPSGPATLFVMCHLHHVPYVMCRVSWCVSCVMCHLHHVSCVVCHVSCVMSHASCASCVVSWLWGDPHSCKNALPRAHMILLPPPSPSSDSALLHGAVAEGVSGELR